MDDTMLKMDKDLLAKVLRQGSAVNSLRRYLATAPREQDGAVLVDMLLPESGEDRQALRETFEATYRIVETTAGWRFYALSEMEVDGKEMGGEGVARMRLIPMTEADRQAMTIRAGFEKAVSVSNEMQPGSDIANVPARALFVVAMTPAGEAIIFGSGQITVDYLVAASTGFAGMAESVIKRTQEVQARAGRGEPN